jgi:hypothetical protein
VRPVISLRQTPDVKMGKDAPPPCDHGTWQFAGSDSERGAAKWRCPTGECSPASVWIKADRLHPLIPRTTSRFKALYHRRGAVEPGSAGSSTNGALPLRVRRIERVRLHADLLILARLAMAAERPHEYICCVATRANRYFFLSAGLLARIERIASARATFPEPRGYCARCPLTSTLR